MDSAIKEMKYLVNEVTDKERKEMIMCKLAYLIP